MRVKIAGMGKCLPGTDLPGRIVTNAEMVKILLAHGAIKPGTDKPWTAEELDPQKIEDLVGIKERQWVADGVNTSDLAVFAADRALEAAGIGWEDVGVLALGSSTPEALFPSTACIVVDKVLRRKIASGEWPEAALKAKLRIPAYDLLAACTSGLYAADLVRKTLLFPETEFDYGLAMGSETLSRLLDFKDTNSDLWGDAAAALVLTRTEKDEGILCALTGTDSWAAEHTFSIGQGTRWGNLNIPLNIMIRGHEIQKWVLRIIIELIEKTLDKANRVAADGKKFVLEDIDLFVCHQANARIFEFPAKKMNITLEKFYVNVDRRGNCSSASVLLALHEAVEEGRVKKGDLVMLLSFGGGLTWGTMLVRW
jgi:3-oxoacyl-[acyl-carrier-protein] synthase-3